jgi:RNA polymerase sigma-70 factor (ECF subfamily)
MSDGAQEAELLRKAGQGDEAAFLLLYERHRTPVFRFACRMLGSAPLAEDVTQECFLAILRRPEGYRPDRGASLRTYLCAIARNLALKQLRRQGQETTTDDPPEAPPGSGERDPLTRVMDEEAAEAVRRAVSALPPLQREVVVLFEYEDMSLAETAAVCDIDVGTVKSRLHRARGRLRRSLAPLLGGQTTEAARVAARGETGP